MPLNAIPVSQKCNAQVDIYNFKGNAILNAHSEHILLVKAAKLYVLKVLYSGIHTVMQHARQNTEHNLLA